MKPSGIEWIGDIPDDWEVRKGKFLFKQRNSRGNTKKLELLSPTQKYGVIPQSKYEELTGMKPVKLDINADLASLKTICNGDYCISLRSFQGGFEYSSYEGVVSPAYQVFYPTKLISRQYYKYLFKVQSFIDKINSYAMSLRDGKNISFEDFSTTYLPFPPLKTQQKIADYLDEKCGEIDATIAKQKESIEKLKAYKQSLISETVTKGLDKSAPLKPSGIEWIGDIPAHWEVKRIKELFSFGKGLPISKEDLIENGVPVINYGQIHSKDNNGTSIKDSLIRYVDLNYKNTNMTSLVESGDFIFADTSEDLDGCGNCIYVDSKYPIFAGYHCIILRSIKRNSSKYLAYLFQMDAWRTQIRRDVTGVKVFSISKKILGKSYILLPPRYEQECIVNYLQEKCNEIDIIINKKQNIIQKLDAYKKSLIFECVTGKCSILG